jgi:hypothetical protein
MTIAFRPPLPALTRQMLEQVIEALIAYFDEMDGDPNLEDGADDEPSFCGYGGDDRELDESDDEPEEGF